ncbi:MAG: hypothetical protein IZT60_07890 [Gammaproteobacteria bacterium]|nr:hypothetical protein [Gammaproteobacteria bacterium]
MKFKTAIITPLIIGIPLLLGSCTQKAPGVDLDRVMKITTESMQRYEQTNLSGVKGEMDDLAMAQFSRDLADDLRMAQPPLYTSPIGIVVSKDGSIQGYNDKNGNYVRETGEGDLFKIEIDSQNNRIIASNDGVVREQGMGMGGGLMMGMLMGSMLSRQSAAGIRPGAFNNKRATPKPRARTKSSFGSARSRAGSGSFSSGK